MAKETRTPGTLAVSLLMLTFAHASSSVSSVSSVLFHVRMHDVLRFALACRIGAESRESGSPNGAPARTVVCGPHGRISSPCSTISRNPWHYLARSEAAGGRGVKTMGPVVGAKVAEIGRRVARK